MQGLVKRDKLNFAPMSEALIRSIIFKSLLFEGFKDDQRYLIEKYPQEQSKLSQLQPKWIGWLISRFGENPKFAETHPFEDALVTIQNFAKKDVAVGDKYKSNEQFKTEIDNRFPPQTRRWQSPSVTTYMNVDEMEAIIGVSERKKERFKSEVSEEEMESDRVGKVGPWNLWMPTTKERSCKIAQYDPLTRAPKTTWCTARMAGSNLFYNYVGQPGREITLFYIIKDNPSLANDWLSVGFVNGNPVLEGQYGGVSVNRDNNGLTSDKLKLALKKDYDQIMLALSDKNKSLGGKHPAREKITAAATSVEALRYLTYGLSQSESNDIINVVLKEPKISAEVLDVLAQNKDAYVRSQVAVHVNTSAKTLTSLVEDTDAHVRCTVARNINTPATTLVALAGDKDISVRAAVAQSSKIPKDSLAFLAEDKHDSVRYYVAKNPNTPVPKLIDLSKDLHRNVRLGVAQNAQTPASVLTFLAKDLDLNVKQAVAKNPQTPDTIIADFVIDKDPNIRRTIAFDINTSPDVLITLSKDADPYVRSGVAANTSAPVAALTTLGEDLNKDVLFAVADNPQTPAQTLTNLAKSRNISRVVAKNPNAPIKLLTDLAKDKDKTLRGNIASNKNVTPELLTKIAEDELVEEEGKFSIHLVIQVIGNIKTPSTTLEKLLKFPQTNVKYAIILSPNVTIPILQKLSKDRSSTIRSAAKTKLTELQQVQNESRLRRLIRQML